MPVYEFTALDKKGKSTSGIIDAEGALVARQKLQKQGAYPVSITEIDDTQDKKSEQTFSMSTAFNRVKPAEVAMMTRQLATLVGAGFPLVAAIDTLIPQTKSQTFIRVIAHLKDAIVEGQSFAQALSLYPAAFSPLYINMVRAGETSGTLEIVLDRLADITEKQQALKTRIRTALAYPILMSIVGVLVLFLLLAFIVPSITSIFTDMNQALPLPTVLLINISDLFKSYWWVLFLLFALMFLGLKKFRKTVKGAYLFDQALLKIPMLGTLPIKLAVSRFTRTLGSLLENGVSMLPALEIVKNIAGNILISDIIEESAKEVGKGQALSVSLAKGNIFPLLAVQMIQVGEQSGDLEAMLVKVADIFENEVESSVMSMTSLLEPIMILVMGVVVGFIVLSICLPIFEMNQLVM